MHFKAYRLKGKLHVERGQWHLWLLDAVSDLLWCPCAGLEETPLTGDRPTRTASVETREDT